MYEAARRRRQAALAAEAPRLLLPEERLVAGSPCTLGTMWWVLLFVVIIVVLRPWGRADLLVVLIVGAIIGGAVGLAVQLWRGRWFVLTDQRLLLCRTGLSTKAPRQIDVSFPRSQVSVSPGRDALGMKTVVLRSPAGEQRISFAKPFNPDVEILLRELSAAPPPPPPPPRAEAS